MRPSVYEDERCLDQSAKENTEDSTIDLPSGKNWDFASMYPSIMDVRALMVDKAKSSDILDALLIHLEDERRAVKKLISENRIRIASPKKLQTSVNAAIPRSRAQQ